MGRPRKPEGEKLVPASTNLKPAEYRALERVARSKDLKVSELLRQLIRTSFATAKTNRADLPVI